MKMPILILAAWLMAVQQPFAQTCADGNSPIVKDISLGGMESWDAAGDPDNAATDLCGFAANGNIVGLAWSGIDLSPIGGSYCKEVAIKFENAVVLRPAITESHGAPCANGYAGGGPGNLQDLGLNFAADASGCVTLEVYETFNDFNNAVDATIDAGTVTLTGCPQGISLPIELLSFSAEAVGEINLIKWVTASEQNSAWHVIERSEDGRGPWVEIGKVAGAGQSTAAKNYEMTDAYPVHFAYYRLKETAFDGQVQYSHVIALQRPSDGFGIRQISPNPATDFLSLIFETGDESEINLTVVDQFGRDVLEQKMQPDVGVQAIGLDIGKLPNGAYFIVLGNGRERKVMGFVKK